MAQLQLDSTVNMPPPPKSGYANINKYRKSISLTRSKSPIESADEPSKSIHTTLTQEGKPPRASPKVSRSPSKCSPQKMSHRLSKRSSPAREVSRNINKDPAIHIGFSFNETRKRATSPENPHIDTDLPSWLDARSKSVPASMMNLHGIIHGDRRPGFSQTGPVTLG